MRRVIVALVAVVVLGCKGGGWGDGAARAGRAAGPPRSSGSNLDQTGAQGPQGSTWTGRRCGNAHVFTSIVGSSGSGHRRAAHSRRHKSKSTAGDGVLYRQPDVCFQGVWLSVARHAVYRRCVLRRRVHKWDVECLHVAGAGRMDGRVRRGVLENNSSSILQPTSDGDRSMRRLLGHGAFLSSHCLRSYVGAHVVGASGR